MALKGGRESIVRGVGTQQRPLLRELWERDSHGQNLAMKTTGTYDPDNRYVNIHRYHDHDFSALEIEKVWKKQWLFAAREEDIPEIGDRINFDVGPLSFLIIKSSRDEYKAFYNACLHRGTKLCIEREKGAIIKCPYHGWQWNVDGSLNFIPGHWDFPEITRKNSGLPEVRLAVWGGFIFINADDDAPPLEEALGVMLSHLADFEPQNRYTKARFRKVVKANWKVTQEAFMESYHALTTHPEAMAFAGEGQSQYDIWPTSSGAIGRAVTPNGIASIYADDDITEVASAFGMLKAIRDWHYPSAELPEPDNEQPGREQAADWLRRTWEATYGRSNPAPDSIFLDSCLYFLYPHFCIWMSEATPLIYQFLPHETDPNLSYFDVRLLMPWPSGEERPPSAPAKEISADETIADEAPEFKMLAYIFDQDMSNLPRVQRGFHAVNPKAPFIRLGRYQESLIQHWHELLDKHVSE